MKRHSIAVLDACVLVPMPLADTLLRLAEPPALYEARWSDEILDEVTRTLRSRFGKSPEKAKYREETMRKFFPGSLVENYEDLTGKMTNHPKDRHVLAAAVACNADCVVTFNRKDFSLAAVTELSIAITGPSTFLKNLWSLDSSLVLDRMEAQARAISIPVGLLLDRLAKTVPAFVDLVRQAGLRPSE